MLLNRTARERERGQEYSCADITPESFGEQIWKTIDFFKTLRATQKNIRLKPLPRPAFSKIDILGDYLWCSTIQASRDVH